MDENGGYSSISRKMLEIFGDSRSFLEVCTRGAVGEFLLIRWGILASYGDDS